MTALAQAFHPFQPDLWENRAGIDLAYAALARLAAQQQDVAAACSHYAMVVDKADKHDA